MCANMSTDVINIHWQISWQISVLFNIYVDYSGLTVWRINIYFKQPTIFGGKNLSYIRLFTQSWKSVKQQLQ